MRIILTGATGMVGEGVLLACIRDARVTSILLLSRKHYELSDKKVTELLVDDFSAITQYEDLLAGYDACFFCAGISSVGMKESDYRRVTYDNTLAVAKAVLNANPASVFIYLSGAGTDSSEKGMLMWARVKGKTENDLIKLPFRAVYNFRPGVMLPLREQKNWKPLFRGLSRVISWFIPSKTLKLQEVGRAMINAVTIGYNKPVLEVDDIRTLASVLSSAS